MHWSLSSEWKACNETNLQVVEWFGGLQRDVYNIKDREWMSRNECERVGPNVMRWDETNEMRCGPEILKWRHEVNDRNEGNAMRSSGAVRCNEWKVEREVSWKSCWSEWSYVTCRIVKGNMARPARREVWMDGRGDFISRPARLVWGSGIGKGDVSIFGWGDIGRRTKPSSYPSPSFPPWLIQQ